MTPADREALKALLAQMHDIHADLADRHAGVCVLHVEAAIAALESRLLRSNGTNMEQRPQNLLMPRDMH